VSTTDYHAKYFAYELTKRCSSDSMEKLAGAVAGAQVDLNPHQVDAALFAFNSPLSKGALLADEVGLGKTIEAGLVLSQKWAERKRRILIIVPSNLRKQWYQELNEKFFLPCHLLETKSYNAAVMNVGKKEGSEIIQLFGRGVRLKGYKFKLKRTSALDDLDFQDDNVPRKHPDHSRRLLRTLAGTLSPSCFHKRCTRLTLTGQPSLRKYRVTPR
jgi:SNF2 family DNA or RNA helicase